VIVDIGRLRELAGVTTEGTVLRLGATTRHHQVAAWTDGGSVAAIPELASRIGDTQVRNMGTVGGGVAAVEPTGDWGTVVLAMRGAMVAVSTRGERTVVSDSFFLGTHRNALAADELVSEVRLPLPERAFGTAFAKFEPRTAAALASCAGCIELADGHVARAGLACVGLWGFPTRLPAAERLLTGECPSAELFEHAVQLVRTEADGGFHGAVVCSLLRQVLQDATERARRGKEVTG
jgi:carbon-monoxide dehydrogenase medium subunit